MQISRRGVLTGMIATMPSAVAFGRSVEPAVPAPTRELRVAVRGGRIYVRVNGDLAAKKAPVIFIHGGPGATHAYLTSMLPLADERAVILYDQLDTGLSDRPNDPANWTVERFVSEIDAIRAALDLTHLHVAGHSWGGTVALEYGARQPGGLRSLTLGSPLISARSWQASTKAQLATMPAALHQTIENHERAGTTDDPSYGKAMKIFYARFAQRTPDPAYLVEYRKRSGLTGNRRLYGEMWGAGEIYAKGALSNYDGEALLPKIKASTLVICGEYDEFTPSAATPLAARIPDATVVSVPGAGHAAMIDNPAFYLRAMRKHLTRADDAAG